MNDLSERDRAILAKREKALAAAFAAAAALSLAAVFFAWGDSVSSDKLDLTPAMIYIGELVFIADVFDLFRNLRFLLVGIYVDGRGRVWLCAVGFVKSAVVCAAYGVLIGGVFAGEAFDDESSGMFRLFSGLTCLAIGTAAVYYALRVGVWAAERRATGARVADENGGNYEIQ